MRASGLRLALATLALTGAACSVPTASVVPEKPKPKVTQAEADAQARRALTHLTVGNKTSAYKLLRDWSLKTNCWTGMTSALFRNLKIEREAFASFRVPAWADTVSHVSAPINPAMGVEGIVGEILVVDCDRKPTHA